MGNLCGSQSSVNPEDAKRNNEINNDLRRDKKRFDQEVKLLLLGAGESGKSTIAKQMKFLYLDGYSKEEKESYRSIIASNTVGSMRVLIAATQEMGREVEGDAAEIVERFMNSTAGTHFGGLITPALGRDIKIMWTNPTIQETYTRSSEFQLNDSAAYYFDQIHRISEADYVVTEQDVLRSRTKTTGIIETEFEVENAHFRMVDVGGQRSERKKWMYCFQDVTAVIFCVAMSEYDLKLYEDDTTNRMHESIKLFKEISNTKWFAKTAMILFLNKKDIFQDKIRRVNLNVCFPEYTGGCVYDEAAQYIRKVFSSQLDDARRPLYIHETCATDTSNVKVVFTAVKDIILNQTLSEAYL